MSSVECELTDDFKKTGIRASDDRYYYTDVFNYVCEDGFIKVGNGTVTCQYDGTWSGTPNCTETETKTGKGLHYTQKQCYHW